MEQQCAVHQFILIQPECLCGKAWVDPYCDFLELDDALHAEEIQSLGEKQTGWKFFYM